MENRISCLAQDFHLHHFAHPRLGSIGEQTCRCSRSERLPFTAGKDVLKFLLKGKCGIIVVLARGMYRQLPKLYEAAMNENRLLVIALEKETVTRVSEYTAHRRNKYVERVANENQTAVQP